MDKDIRQNRLLKFHNRALNILGIVYFDDQKWPRFEYFKGILCICTYFLFNVTQYIFLYQNMGDVSRTSICGGTALLYTTMIVKSSTFIKNNKIYFQLMTDMHTSMKRIERFENRVVNKLVDDHVKHSDRIAWCMFVSTDSSLVAFTAYIITIFLIINEPDVPIRPIALDTWYPFATEKHNVISYLIVQWMAFLAFILVPFWNTLIISMLVYARCMFRILKYRLRHPEEFIKIPFKQDVIPEKEQYHFTVDCVKDHLIIMKFVEDIRDLISLPMGLDFLMFLFLLCSEMFQLSTNALGIVELGITIGYLSCTVTLVLMYYWHANEISLESEDLSDAAFESPWLNSSKRNKVALSLLMVRTRKPLILHAGLFPMNLQTFIMILRASYSAFTVLRQFE